MDAEWGKCGAVANRECSKRSCGWRPDPPDTLLTRSNWLLDRESGECRPRVRVGELLEARMRVIGRNIRTTRARAKHGLLVAGEGDVSARWRGPELLESKCVCSRQTTRKPAHARPSG